MRYQRLHRPALLLRRWLEAILGILLQPCRHLPRRAWCGMCTEYAKKNVTLRERQTGSGMEYVLIQRMKPVDSDDLLRSRIFIDGRFNVVSQKFLMQGQPDQTQEYTFRKEKGVFIPFKFEFKQYFNRNVPKDSDRTPTQHRVFTLTKTQVNEPIDPSRVRDSVAGTADRRSDGRLDRASHGGVRRQAVRARR